MSQEQDDPRSALDDRTIHPKVRMPSSGLSGAAIAGICAVLAIGLFLILDANRRGNEQAGARAAPANATIASPQPLSLPLPPPAPIQSGAPIPVATTSSAPPAPPMAENRFPAPMAPAYMPPMPSPLAPAPTAPRTKGEGGDSPLIIDLASADGLGNASAAAGGAGDDQAVRASVIRNRSSLVPQGSMIRAVLETPIDSRRPGLVRAVVSRDARGFDGTRVLIPRGSRLIGEASGDAKEGQKRVLVTWTRLIRPDGVAIRIGSPAADVLGGAGIRGKVNNHFIERFGNAVLQSALTIGVNVASRPRSNSVIVGLPGQIGAAGQSFLPNVDPAPTIKVASGAEISVFVARDLDFSGTGLRR
ncbi:TrbI/VirB10 family protein [Sphingobium sp. BYY-5]|uniref:TrbI/VirB10 family protein n=1 Tax=Sphingobium sp. BYY-5 TaxID=2926400 RepID=UPI001FA79D35|nr:TrbI/VirB10 family protein [Sphingobium sp. BYY-5]MCI4590393.1 TrbI/VirB10 family protein [Sphingobium sp. BYY-5]MCI4591491.1 TrbI/VirB10 family protein [Sphingobium sp. BYY-5]